MNQTKKRLSIINLAISMTDLDTIQLQMLKLKLLKSDDKLQEILRKLQNENYGQVQALITSYIDTPMHEILQRTIQEDQIAQELKERSQREEEAQPQHAEEPENVLLFEEEEPQSDTSTIKEFGLFSRGREKRADTEIRTLDLDDMLKLAGDDDHSSTSTDEQKNKQEISTLSLDDMLELEQEAIEEIPRKVHETVNFDSLLEVSSEDILPDNIDLDISHGQSSDFWEEMPSHTPESETTDTFFEEEEILSEPLNDEIFEELTEEEESEVLHKDIGQEGFDLEKEFETHNHQEDHTKEENVDISEEIQMQEPVLKYKAIPYIDQKLKNMQVQYPSVDESNAHFESVDNWLLNISNNGYTEVEVEVMINHIDTIRTESLDEAAQLLLISAATESKYAQFQLARTLYKGDILQKNLPEAFTLINRLAMNDDYPEAICDLAQFYEHGAGIEKDKNRALILYQEAMEAGIQRAASHVERLTKSNKGLFSFLKK